MWDHDFVVIGVLWCTMGGEECGGRVQRPAVHRDNDSHLTEHHSVHSQLDDLTSWTNDRKVFNPVHKVSLRVWC